MIEKDIKECLINKVYKRLNTLTLFNLSYFLKLTFFSFFQFLVGAKVLVLRCYYLFNLLF